MLDCQAIASAFVGELRKNFAPGRPVLLGLLLVLSSATATAHDLWLIPNEPAAVGEPVTVRAQSGTVFPKGERAPDTSAFERRVLIKPGGKGGALEAAGKEDTSGLLRFTPERAGIYIAAIETHPKLITLEADAFNAYLVEDGLPHIYQLRSREKILDQPGRERYTKSPKTILQVGRPEGGDDPCRIVGLPLEIIPLRNPLALKVGDTLAVRVLFRDKPLADAILGWNLPDDGEAPRGTVRTDTKGEALVPIGKTGLMTIRLTHMTRPKAKDYEWESFWTTLTFRIPE
jgi:uncharacterized GH25 family protein